jgi:hypothetical protein
VARSAAPPRSSGEVVLLTGEGEPSFCAGFDLDALPDDPAAKDMSRLTPRSSPHDRRAAPRRRDLRRRAPRPDVRRGGRARVLLRPADRPRRHPLHGPRRAPRRRLPPGRRRPPAALPRPRPHPAPAAARRDPRRRPSCCAPAACTACTARPSSFEAAQRAAASACSPARPASLRAHRDRLRGLEPGAQPRSRLRGRAPGRLRTATTTGRPGPPPASADPRASPAADRRGLARPGPNSAIVPGP